MNNISFFRKILKGSAMVFIGNSLIYFIGFVYHISIVRILGPEKYGTWGLIYTIVSMVAFLSVAGINIGTMYFLSKFRLSYNDKSIGEILKSSFFLVLLLSLVIAFGLILFTTFWLKRIYPYIESRSIMYIMCFAVPFIAFARLSEFIFRAFENVDASYKIKIVQDSFKLLFIPVVLILTNGSLNFLASLTLISFILPVLYGGYIINKLIFPLKKLFTKMNTKFKIKELIKYSWPLSFNEYISLIFKRMDILFIGYFLTATSVGIYRVAVIFASTLRFVPVAMVYLLFPILNKLFETDKSRDSFLLAERTYKYMIYLNMPILCFIVLFSRNILVFIYGNSFAEGAVPLIFLALTTSTVIFHTVPGNILVLKEKTKTILYIYLIGTVINILGNLILIPKYGLFGAAFTTFISSSLIMILIILNSSLVIKKFIFPWKTIGILIAAILVIVLSLTIRERNINFNIMVYSIFLGFTIIWVNVFERNELIQGWKFIRSRLHI